jgi:hypothetical protein
MTTTHASTAAPKPVESSAAKPAQAGARATAADKPADADLFSSLLSLVSDTHQAQAPVVLTTETLPVAGTDTGTDDDDALLNPLAALLAWATTPASAAAAPAASAQAPAGATPATDAQALPADSALPTTGVDIEGMARVDEALPAPAAQAANAARAALASRPAFSAPPAHAATSQRATEGAAPAGAPAMVWQRGAVSSTEFLQHQHATQLAQVRSTVALNERFGLPGATEPVAPALREFTTATTTVAGGAPALASAPDAGTAVAGAQGADTGSGGEHAPDAHTDSAPGDAQGRADAGPEAEGPTVSHWGTQHLRHASLRVGGEGGADAIDIQLAVKGQEVQVAFQTDNAEARASLRESAGGSLAELLQRSGIQLGSVSVGAHGQPQGGGSNARPASSPRTEALGRSAPVADASRPMAPPRADGSRPLDVFA